GEDLLGAHPPVLVGVDQLQGAGVDLQPLHRAAQGDPQLLVERLERGQVGACVQCNLIQPAHSVKLESVRHVAIVLPKRRTPCWTNPFGASWSLRVDHGASMLRGIMERGEAPWVRTSWLKSQ